MTPEVASQVEMWRSLAAQGKLSTEEMKKAILILRGDRIGASVASKTSRAKRYSAGKQGVPSAADLLAELDDDEEGDEA